MPLTDLDRNLIERCKRRDPNGWIEFIDRFSGLIIHVIRHAADMRSVSLQPQDVEDLAADVIAQVLADDMKILRRFRGRSSLATYLAVIARRVVVDHLARRAAIQQRTTEVADLPAPGGGPDVKLETEEEIQHALRELSGKEADVFRAYYLELKTYREIAKETGVPENTIGPMLTRIRERIRKAAPHS